MKTLLISLLFCVSVSIYGQDYNKAKDVFINKCLDNKPIKTSITNGFNSVSYTIRYETIELYIIHEKYVPYEQKDSWTYHATKIDGTYYPIDSILDCEANKLSPVTYRRIREICLKLEREK